MNDRDSLTEFVARASSELNAQGFPRMPGTVLMALTASEHGRLTVAELSELLGISPAAISGAIRYLTTLGFVRASTVPGTRRHVYSLPETPWYSLSLTRPGIYGHIVALLRSEVNRLAPSAARDRIEQMADFFSFIEARMPRLLEEWYADRAARRGSPGRS